MNNRLINTKVAGGGGGCTDIVDNYDPFGDSSGLALYQLNGNANDVSGNYNGTASNITYETGVFGQAGVFNGVNGKITSTSPVQGNTDATVSFWVKAPSVGTSKQIFAQDADNARNPFTVQWYDSSAAGKMTWSVWRCFDNQIWYSTSYLSDFDYDYQPNTWYHIVLTYTASDKSLRNYVNGAKIGNTPTLSLLTSATTSTQNVWGSYNNLSSEYLDASLDQVRYFNKVLDPLEVEALYTEELCICDGTVDTLDILGDGSCIATYQLDGNANDLSGNYSGTPTNVSYGVGEFDLAGVFNGSSSLITLPSSINISYINPSGQFSFSLWVKLNEVGTNDYRIIDFDVPNNIELTLNGNGQQAGKIIWIIYNTSYEFLVSNTTVVANTWYHISVTYNNGFSELFINGSSEGTMSKTLVQSSQNIGLGARFNNTENTNGSIDQFRIFNKALNQAEVTTLYNETACSTNPLENVDFHYDPTTLSDGAVTAWSDSGAIGRSLDLVSASGTITKNTSAGIQSVDIPFIQSNSYLRVGGSSYTTYSDYPTNTSFTLSMFVNISTSYINFDQYVYLSNFSTASGVELGEFTNFIWRYGLNPQEYDVTPVIQGIDFWLYSDVTPAMDFRPYGTWRMLTVTFEYNPSATSYLKWYYDGTLIHTVSNTGTWGASATSFSLGVHNSISSRRDGGVKYGDVLGFFGEAKSHSEIAAIYTSLKGKYGL